MIKTPYKMQFTEFEDKLGETEKDFRKIYPGLRLIREHKDTHTNLWVHRVWFENEKDYTWFELKHR